MNMAPLFLHIGGGKTHSSLEVIYHINLIMVKFFSRSSLSFTRYFYSSVWMTTISIFPQRGFKAFKNALQTVKRHQTKVQKLRLMMWVLHVLKNFQF